MTRWKKCRVEQFSIKKDRGAFWQYCKQTAGASLLRAKKTGVLHSITAYDIDALLIDQQWRCAISGVLLEPPASGTKGRCHPFGPSLDRITPSLGYVPKNIRIVCNMVNTAMSDWGVANLLKLINAIAIKELHLDCHNLNRAITTIEKKRKISNTQNLRIKRRQKAMVNLLAYKL